MVGSSFTHWGWLEDIPSLAKIEVLTDDIRNPHRCDELAPEIGINFHPFFANLSVSSAKR